MKLLLCTIKSWNIAMANMFINKYSHDHTIKLITQKEELTLSCVQEYNPDIIFFPHWSYIISEEIYENYTCVVFHMTDLPFGRGGSPLQNLISRGIHSTKISAIKVSKGLDAGPIYLKKDLDLSSGNATDIFTHASEIIFNEMIPYIICNNPIPKAQEGTPTVFMRRTPADSELKPDFSLIKIHDYIRMLDAEGYPSAYLDFGSYRLLFTNSELGENKISATVTIVSTNEEI